MGLSSKEVSGDTLDWSQIGNLEIPKPIGEARSQQQQQREERQKVPPLKCPRCDSTNTKFCYYNNYSRQQPRHFCRACRRHWTEGGTLRNVPVGGGRKNKRSKINHTANANDDGNQQQVAVPFGGIFPDIFSQVFFHSPQPLQPLLSSDYSGKSSGSFVDSLLSAPPFLSEFGGTEPVVLSSCDNAGNPFSISNSSSSSIGDDGLLTMMDGSTTSTWLQEPPALPASYWSCWDGDFADQ